MATERMMKAVTDAYMPWAAGGNLEAIREGYDSMAPALPDDVVTEPMTVGGVPGLYLRPAGVAETSTMLLYFHGGGYMIGSSRSHAEMVSHLVRKAQCSAFLPDYRLAPEHPFPAAVDDAVAVYRGLLATWSPDQLIIAGDSAGGGLSLATVLVGRNEGLPVPACIVGLSTWADLTMSSPTCTENVHKDPICTPETYEEAAIYLAGHDAKDPLASPVFADLTGFPPLLLQVGTDETLLWDTLQIAEHARNVGVEVDLEIALEMVHVYQMLTWSVPEAHQALERIAQFMLRHVREPLARAR